jgi:hypothetical protein
MNTLLLYCALAHLKTLGSAVSSLSELLLFLTDLSSFIRISWWLFPLFLISLHISVKNVPPPLFRYLSRTKIKIFRSMLCQNSISHLWDIFMWLGVLWPEVIRFTIQLLDCGSSTVLWHPKLLHSLTRTFLSYDTFPDQLAFTVKFCPVLCAMQPI